MQTLSNNQSTRGLQNRPSFSEINVTPLVDVMLVLLIIFMVTAPMLQQGIEIKLPESNQKDFSTSASDEYVLTIEKTGKLFLNESEIPIEHLELKLRQLNASKPIRALFLRADKDVQYGYVIIAIDKVKQAGITTIGMVTEPVEAS